MKIRLAMVAGMLFTSLLISREAAAQFGPTGASRPSFGPRLTAGARVGRDFDADVWSVGGQLRFSLPFLRGIEVMPNGDLYMTDGDVGWQLNLDGVIRPARLRLLYAGAGLAVARAVFFIPDPALPGVRSKEIGYNLLLGLQLPLLRVPVWPFVEGRWTFIRRTDPFRIVAGVNIPFGRSVPGR